VLTLTRSVGESIRIGEDIEVYVVEVRGGTVRLGFKAPREVTIHREEVYRQIAEANSLAAEVAADALKALAAFAPGQVASPRQNMTTPQPIRLNNRSTRTPQ
jgi:carbon storage regulator